MLFVGFLFHDDELDTAYCWSSDVDSWEFRIFLGRSVIVESKENWTEVEKRREPIWKRRYEAWKEFRAPRMSDRYWFYCIDRWLSCRSFARQPIHVRCTTEHREASRLPPQSKRRWSLDLATKSRTKPFSNREKRIGSQPEKRSTLNVEEERDEQNWLEEFHLIIKTQMRFVSSMNS